MVKVEAAETLGRVADRAVQVFGGMGYCAEMPIERLYRDARIYRIFDGTSEIHRGDRRPQRAQARRGPVGHRRAMTPAVPARARAARVDGAAPASW